MTTLRDSSRDADGAAAGVAPQGASPAGVPGAGDAKAFAAGAGRWERIRSWAGAVWAIVGICILVYLLYLLCGKFSAVINLLLLTGLFTFLLRTPVAWMERHRIPRAGGAAIAILALIAVIVVLVWVIATPVFNQVSAFVADLPGYLAELQSLMSSVGSNSGSSVSIGGYELSPELQSLVGSALSKLAAWVSSELPQTGESVVSALTSTVSGFITVIMSLVAAYWILKDLPRMGREMRVLAGPKHEEGLRVTHAIGVRVFGGYIWGLLIASTVTGAIAGIGYTLLGMPYSWLLGLITGLLNVIPYIGPWTGGIIGALVGLTISPWVALGAIVTAICAQEITDIFVTPRVYGSTVQLHPALVIIALAIGQALGGVVGMILAVPGAAAVKAIIIYWFERKTGRQVVSKRGALFTSKPWDPQGGQVNPAYDAAGVDMSEPYEMPNSMSAAEQGHLAPEGSAGVADGQVDVGSDDGARGNP